TVAHQLRNPLGVIIGFSEMLTKGMPPEQAPEAMTRILRNGIRCKEIVQDLLDFGRGEPREYAPADLNAIIRDRVQSAFTNGTDECIAWELSDSLPPIECAVDQIAQVLINLVDNALCASTSRVTVATGTEGGQVVVRVSDDGPGVPDSDRERIFEPFFTTRKESGGVGLGLCLSRTVVQEHRGTLTLDESVSPGACFVVRIPVMETARDEQPDVSPPPTPPAQTGRRVLIVEDETDLQFLLGMALQSEGHEVDAAVTGAQAMELFLAGKYDAVVIDMLLADGLGGRDLYQYLLQTDPELAARSLFVTGDMMKYETRRFLNEVKRPYLEKPFLISDFTAQVEALFEQPSAP
ncbi:MAG: ATP-binding protein, partial [Candidatus Hydrogenedentes bacterium]|nr:ATP-binding protein [Candidatus Hydrogenedentota bacterium]